MFYIKNIEHRAVGKVDLRVLIHISTCFIGENIEHRAVGKVDFGLFAIYLVTYFVYQIFHFKIAFVSSKQANINS